MSESEENQFKLPIHGLRENAKPFIKEEIAYRNTYDFTEKHRHKYYELLFFRTGGGLQLIDFEEYNVKDHSAYIVLPNQIHLLKRQPKSSGFIVQFYPEELTSNKLLSFLRIRGWTELSGEIFSNNPELYTYFEKLFSLSVPDKNYNSFSIEKDRHLLQCALFAFFSGYDEGTVKDTTKSMIGSFLSVLEENYKSEHQVNFYSTHLGITDKKLTESSNKHLGITALKVIHARILLEAKRMLLFGSISQKEIAYELGFESPSSFSAFVKLKTGVSPSHLQNELEGIHK